MRRYVLHGVLAGLAGGFALALVLLLVGEDSIGRAVALEQQRSGGQADALFGRGAQQAGGALAAVVYGVAIGAIFGMAFAGLRRRLATPDDWRAAVALAGIGFVTLFLVPFLKYPANPPAVGDPDTIGQRTLLWLLVLAWSVVATWAVWRTALWLRQRDMPDQVRVPAVAGLYGVIVVCGLVLLPGTPDAVTAPATLLWRFRLASVAGVAAFWAVLGTVFGWLHLAAQGQKVAGRLRSPSRVGAG